MNNYYVTETLEEAQANEAADYIEFHGASPLLPAEYWATTTAWSIPVQRLDGKWIRAFCLFSTAVGRRIEAYVSSWFPDQAY
tara:strand:+ start:952 stop:1197 length:246 start_codon:yes stop_codon:yes gene_type:complete